MIRQSCNCVVHGREVWGQGTDTTKVFVERTILLYRLKFLASSGSVTLKVCVCVCVCVGGGGGGGGQMTRSVKNVCVIHTH